MKKKRKIFKFKSIKENLTVRLDTIKGKKPNFKLIYIWCPKCERTTLHESIKVKVSKRKDVIMPRTEIHYKCRVCGNVQKFKVKKEK